MWRPGELLHGEHRRRPKLSLVHRRQQKDPRADIDRERKRYGRSWCHELLTQRRDIDPLAWNASEEHAMDGWCGIHHAVSHRIRRKFSIHFWGQTIRDLLVPLAYWTATDRRTVWGSYSARTGRSPKRSAWFWRRSWTTCDHLTWLAEGILVGPFHSNPLVPRLLSRNCHRPGANPRGSTVCFDVLRRWCRCRSDPVLVGNCQWAW